MTTNTSTLARLWREIAFSLCVLNRMQFSAPWQRRAKGC